MGVDHAYAESRDAVDQLDAEIFAPVIRGIHAEPSLIVLPDKVGNGALDLRATSR
jgi:hypothetical protein